MGRELLRGQWLEVNYYVFIIDSGLIHRPHCPEVLRVLLFLLLWLKELVCMSCLCWDLSSELIIRCLVHLGLFESIVMTTAHCNLIEFILSSHVVILARTLSSLCHFRCSFICIFLFLPLNSFLRSLTCRNMLFLVLQIFQPRLSDLDIRPLLAVDSVSLSQCLSFSPHKFIHLGLDHVHR